MSTVAPDNMVIGFVVPQHVFREIEKHSKYFKSRSEFVGKAIELCLDNR